MRPLSLVLSVSALSLALSGCSLSPTADPSPEKGASLQGRVYGGRQPIVGAHVYLMSAGTAGYFAGATSLLTSGLSGTDTIGGYVSTDSSGSFSVTGDYTCTSGSQVYLYAAGGDAGAGPNSAVGLIAALGACPASGTLATTVPYVVINEVTTVAAAVALGPYAADATHISSAATAQSKTGIQNAFLNAANLADVSTGVTRSTTPAGNATVPQGEINTMADVLAACVNSAGPSSTACLSLFSDVRSAGTTGTLATETATEAIYIAHHPAVNVAGLYALVPATGAPFQPTLSSQPADFTVTLLLPVSPAMLAVDSGGNVWTCSGYGLLKFAGNGALLSPTGGYTGGGLANPYACGPIAIDPSDNVWVVALNGTSALLAKFANDGTPLSGTGFTGNGLTTSSVSIAIDGSSNVWIVNNNGNLSEFNSAGAAATGSPFSGNGMTSPSTIAIDGLGNVWVSGSQLSKFTNAGAAAAGSPFGAVANGGSPIAIDGSNNVWLAGGTGFVKLTNSGTAATGSPFTGGGASYGAFGIAIDGFGDGWADSQTGPFGPGSLAEVSNTGNPLAPSTGYLPQNVDESNDPIVVDPSGNVWVNAAVYPTDDSILAITIGQAAPVITPLSLGVKNNKLGTRP